MQNVQQLGGVLRRPGGGPDVAERRGRAAVADEGPGAVAAAVGEPLRQHPLARHLVGPHLRRDVVHEARADAQAARGGVVGHRLRHLAVGDGALLGDRGARRAHRHARRPGRAAGGGVGEALAEGVQPDDLAAERGGLGEERGVGRDGDAQAGLDQVLGEARDVAGVGGDGGDVGKQILRRHRCAQRGGEARERGGAEVRRRRLGIGPEGKDAAAEGAFVVILVRDVGAEGQRRAGGRRRAAERGKEHLFAGVCSPQLRTRVVQHARVADDPLSVKRPESVAHRSRHRATVLCDRHGARRDLPQRLSHHLVDVPACRSAVAELRVEQPLLPRRVRLGREPPPALLQRPAVGRDHPGAARHHAGAVVGEQVGERRVRRPSARRCR